MPFDVTVEEPYSRVISLEAENNISIRSQDEGISSHRGRRVIDLARVCSIKITSLFLGSSDGLEVVAMEMERMLSGV